MPFSSLFSILPSHPGMSTAEAVSVSEVDEPFLHQDVKFVGLYFPWLTANTLLVKGYNNSSNLHNSIKKFRNLDRPTKQDFPLTKCKEIGIHREGGSPQPRSLLKEKFSVSLEYVLLHVWSETKQWFKPKDSTLSEPENRTLCK